MAFVLQALYGAAASPSSPPLHEQLHATIQQFWCTHSDSSHTRCKRGDGKGGELDHNQHNGACSRAPRQSSPTGVGEDFLLTKFRRRPGSFAKCRMALIYKPWESPLPTASNARVREAYGGEPKPRLGSIDATPRVREASQVSRSEQRGRSRNIAPSNNRRFISILDSFR
ncbi:unnamed protein product [Ectocarpus fasciculatus]